MTFKRAEVVNSSKKGIKSVTKLFQGLNMVFISKKDKKCKVFGFWAKTVKVPKNRVLTEKYHSGRAESVNKIDFWLKTTIATNL